MIFGLVLISYEYLIRIAIKTRQMIDFVVTLHYYYYIIDDSVFYSV